MRHGILHDSLSRSCCDRGGTPRLRPARRPLLPPATLTDTLVADGQEPGVDDAGVDDNTNIQNQSGTYHTAT